MNDKYKIRSRTSYKMFSHFLNIIRTRSEREILEALHTEIDARSGYRSATNAAYADESLALLLADEPEVSNDGRGDLGEVINYLWENEKKHYTENPTPNHIFLALKRLRREFQIINRCADRAKALVK